MLTRTIMQIFLLVFGNGLAVILALLGLETTPTNFLGWFILATGIAYASGSIIHFWLSRNKESGQVAHSSWWILPGFLVILFAPPAEFLFMAPILPRGLGMELTGLLLLLLGLAVLLWTRSILRERPSTFLFVRNGHVLATESSPYLLDHIGYTGFLVYAGFLILALGLCTGYSSLIGLAAIPVLLLPGMALRMRIEDRLLIKEFREKNRDDLTKSKRLLPGIR